MKFPISREIKIIYCSSKNLLVKKAETEDIKIISRLAIKRSLFVVDSLLSCVGNRLPIFNTKEIKLSETAVDMDPIHITSVSPRMKSPFFFFFFKIIHYLAENESVVSAFYMTFLIFQIFSQLK